MKSPLDIIKSISKNINFRSLSMVGVKRLEGEFTYNEKSKSEIESINISNDLNLSIFDDGFPIQLSEAITGKNYTFKISQKNNKSLNTYENWDSFLDLNSNKISKGIKPEEFLILKENKTTPKDNLNDLIELISVIKKVSTYHDEKSSNTKKYVFISHHAETKDFSEIEVHLSNNLLEHCKIDSKKLSTFKKDENNLSENDEDKWNIFSASIVEFCNEKLPKDNFIKITKNFNDLYTLYRNNYSVFQNKFKFQNLKREISEKHIEFIKKIEENTSSIYTKSLSIPLSASAISGIQSIDNTYQSIPILVGSLILAIILSESIHEKIKIIQNLKETNEKLLEIDSKYPKTIITLIGEKVTDINNTSGHAIRKMKILSLSSFVVSLVATVIWAKKHNIDDYISTLIP